MELSVGLALSLGKKGKNFKLQKKKKSGLWDLHWELNLNKE